MAQPQLATPGRQATRPQSTAQLMATIGELMAIELQAQIVAVNPQGTDLKGSDLYKSVTYESGDDFIKVLANDYIIWVDGGRSPGKRPPLTAILGWIKKNNIIPEGKTTQAQLAYLIARKIGREGVKARPFLKTTQDKLEDILLDMIPDYLSVLLTAEFENARASYVPKK